MAEFSVHQVKRLQLGDVKHYPDSVGCVEFWTRRLIVKVENEEHEIMLYSRESAESLTTPEEKNAAETLARDQKLGDDMFADGYLPDLKDCPEEAVLYLNWRNHGGKTDAEKLALHVKEEAGVSVAF